MGANATIVCGVTIGRFALVGAGAVVVADVPDHGLVAGVPARLIGHVCRCGATLGFGTGVEARCASCGSVSGNAAATSRRPPRRGVGLNWTGAPRLDALYYALRRDECGWEGVEEGAGRFAAAGFAPERSISTRR